ncbi:uncharacterized protein BX663DRAFT_515135 [Cokeromyces recurvatus]|uniref:uncharacterized protein n=1 Tax=Cokeromyces recurvatus TaxID=90255 RepID=UPI0022206BAD|nr:uncharacterized protein BX663DRAFT_515135 [Cokeromyces recurvatus]KAI7901156.1 hypothetical protein BX663DRAFT_515135 [Cokeromyces recurvatus]
MRIYAYVCIFTFFFSLPLVDLDPSCKYNEEDPMEDPYFMAFLTSISSSEPTLSSHRYPSQQQQFAFLPQQFEYSFNNGSSSSSGSPKSIPSIKKKKKRSSLEESDMTTQKKATSTKIGYCEHPKHVFYRQERHMSCSNGNESATSVMKATPRRGRPPKGSKATDFIYSTSPSSAFLPTDSCYPIVELTVRPLPKRLEAVVGKSNIKVCLTCLKRSDLDPDYIHNEAYIGPQQLSKRRK